jgi:NTE family protein
VSLFGPRSVGLALGGGSARGFAHVGVLKVFERESIHPSAIAGTSAGAMCGAMYAAGMTAAQIEELALSLDARGVWGLLDPSVRGGALISGAKMEAWLAEHLPATFEELHVPFGCTSTDLVEGRAVQHTSGDLVKAVRASSAVPLTFRPVFDGGRVLVDGFLTDPVPVELARSLGVRIVIAVDVSGSGRIGTEEAVEGGSHPLQELRASIRGERPRVRGTSSIDVAAATVEMLERTITAYEVKDADVVISPDVHAYGGTDFAFVEQIIAAGERAAEQALNEIRRKARL